MTSKIGILGSGSWATALAKILTDNGHTIHWWIRNATIIDTIKKHHHNPYYLPAAHFDIDRLHMSNTIADVIQKSNMIVICIPSAYVTAALWDLPADIFADKKIISAVKGILPNDRHQLLNEFLEQHFGVKEAHYYTLMGPCHAEEVAAEKLSYLTFSGSSATAAGKVAADFKTNYLNTIVNDDIWGAQYAAVLKNIYAVGAGIAHALDYGDNFLSVLIANAAGEMETFLRKVAAAMPASKSSELHLLSAGYAASVYLGDLLVTCYSLFSRNRMLGNMIGKGYSVKVAQMEMNMVAEGYPASKGIYYINQTVKASMPIAETIYKILWEGWDARDSFKKIEKKLR